MLATTDGVQEFNTDAFTFGVSGDDAKDAWNDMKDQLSYLYQLEDKGDVGAKTRSLRTTLNWGVEYELPYYRRLHFGLVNSTTFNGLFTATEFRFSANVRPVDILSASANFVAGTCQSQSDRFQSLHRYGPDHGSPRKAGYPPQ